MLSREILEKEYRELCDYCGIKNVEIVDNINKHLKKMFKSFCNQNKKIAIWCYGEHTKMLLADFVYELKSVEYIIDNEINSSSGSGYTIITSEEIEKSQIDGIIISSYKYRQEIKDIINTRFSNITYLDIYDELSKMGVELNTEYYNNSHPYSYYKKINILKNKIKNTSDFFLKKELVEQLINICIQIKDFLTALEIVNKSNDVLIYDKYISLRELLTTIYQHEMELSNNISSQNVLMLCIDGLRRSDVENGLLPQIGSYIKENMNWYSNAYSISTSTYESLIPAYSENVDLRTKYYERNLIEEKGCRFINKALEQGRKVIFYTDSMRFVDNPNIKVFDQQMTASEKFWNYILDASEIDNGLFYIHVLYESHFSYPNPYTADELVAGGMSIYFDYLEKNGGAIKCDYNTQHKDALRYLDHIIYPFLNKMNNSMVLYADHGNNIFDKNYPIEILNPVSLNIGKDVIEVPIAIKYVNKNRDKNDNIMSLIEINNIVISLLENREYASTDYNFIKVQRSKIYNPDYHHLYSKMNYYQGIEAFEAFVFGDYTRLIVYQNGVIELYDFNCEKIEDSEVVEKKYKMIKDNITVF